jgi:hypothetical protein
MASTRHWRLFGVAAGLPAAAVGVTVAVGAVRVTGENPVEVIGFLPVFVLTFIVLCGLNVVEVVYLCYGRACLGLANGTAWGAAGKPGLV